MQTSKSFRIRIILFWLQLMWFWKNPFYKWAKLNDVIADDHWRSVLMHDGKITPEALDIIHERILRIKSGMRAIDLVRTILLVVILLSIFGIVTRFTIQGAELELNAKIREVLLLIALTLTLCSSFGGMLSSALYACLKSGIRQADLSPALNYKYFNQSDLFLEFIFKKNISLAYFLNLLLVSLLFIAHLFAYLLLDVGAYIYVALQTHAHPAFGSPSIALADYTIFMIASVFLLTLTFGVWKFRFFDMKYDNKRKAYARYRLLFILLALRRRILAGNLF